MASLKTLETKIKDLQSQRDRLSGSISEKKKELHRRFGVKDKDEAKERRKKIKKALLDLKEQYESELEKLQEEFGEHLENDDE